MAAVDSHPERRGSLLAAAMGAVAGAILIATVASANAAPAPRTAVQADADAAAVISTGAIEVFFDHVHVGTASAMEGCTLVGVFSTADNGVYQAKEFTGTQLEPCEITLTYAMTQPLKLWLHNEVHGKNSTKNISLVRLSATGKPAAALTLTDAHLVGLSMSSLNADAGIEANSVTIELAASDSTRPAPSDFQDVVTIVNPATHRGPFQVTLGDTAQAVISMSSLRMTRSFDGSNPGSWAARDVTLETLRAGGAAWDEWYRSSVIVGRTDERAMKVDLFRPGSTTVLATISLGGVGLVAADGGLDDSRQRTSHRSFRAYVETMDLLIP